LPLRFEETTWSTGERRAFVARGAGYAVSVSDAGATLLLKGSSGANPHRLTMTLAGSRRQVAARPGRALPGVSNYILGNDPTRWVRSVRGYGELEYREVYSGIDIVFYGTQQQLEYDFIVAPGTSPDAIVMAYGGASGLRLDGDGNLVIGTAGGDVVQHRPEIYQNEQGGRRTIRGGYVLRRDGTIGVRVGRYNRRLPLIIDPVMSYATYLGGTGFERVGGVAIDAAGNVIVAGTTSSTNFPVVNPIQTTPRGTDLFVAKLTPAGDALVYATYFGGTGYDNASGVAVDDAGNAYVTGYTESWDFPATTRIGPPAAGGISDAFVVKVDSAGSLVYSTWIGGGYYDYANAIAVDAQGRAHVTGNTLSADFPVVNPLQPQLGGDAAFHSIDGGQTWSASGRGLKTSGVIAFAFDPVQAGTVYASTRSEGVFRTVDGGTTWTQTSLPVQPVGTMAAQGGAIFVAAAPGVYRSSDHGDTWTNVLPPFTYTTAIVATSGSPSRLYAALSYGGVLRSDNGGNTWTDSGLHERALFLAAGGDTVYAATPWGLYKSTAGGSWTVSDLRLGDQLTALAVDANDPQVAYLGTDRGLFKTVSGGTEWFPLLDSGTPYIGAIALSVSDPSTIFVSSSWGTSVSHDGGQSWSSTGVPYDVWPNVIAVDPRDGANVYAGTRLNWDAFLAILSPDGSRLESSTFIGGRGSDAGRGVAVDPDGNVYISGETDSTDFPTTNPIQAALRGGLWDWDAFVVKLSPQGTPVYSTYLGGSATEFGGRIAVDAAGRAYITGNTWSSDFPLANAARPSPGGGGYGDVFVTALDETGTALVYSTYLGGSGVENPSGIEPSIAVTSAGEAAVTGATGRGAADAMQSNDFPTTVDALRRSPGGGDDAFLSQFDAAGALRYSTYLGRPGADYGQAVAVDSTGIAIVAGYTNSTSWSTAGVVQPALRGGDDAFVVKVGPGTPPPDTIAPKTTILAIPGTIGLNGWFTSAVTVSLRGLDDPLGRGLAFFEYSVNGGAFQRYTAPVTVSEQGTVSVAARATDWSGNVENPPAVTSFMTDSLPPSASVSKSGTSGLNDWYTSPVTISIAASDSGSGVSSVDYRINGGAFQHYTAPFSVSTQGANDITTRTTDKAGNVSISAPISVPIDTSAPSTTISLSGTAGLDGWYRSPVTVSISAVDNASGVDSGAIVYSINGGAFQPYTAPFVVAAEGTTRIVARATDRAGNVAAPSPASSFMIDSSAPVVTITSPAARDYLHSDTLVVSFSTGDGLSGVQAVAATLDRYIVQDGLPIPLRLLPLGDHAVTVSATDAAGNVATRSVPFRVVATIGSLVTLVNFYADGGYIDEPNRKSLIAKLNDAQTTLDHGNVSGASAKLNDFINQCTIQSARYAIDNQAAALLIADAQYVLAGL
jgi:hypothetical protein